jgi:hypothetical protein
MTTGEATMTDKDKSTASEDVPGSEIPGHLQEEMHHGIEEITDMGDYALDEAEKIALGIDRMPDIAQHEDDTPEKPAKPERISE